MFERPVVFALNASGEFRQRVAMTLAHRMLTPEIDSSTRRPASASRSTTKADEK
jgi:hypothetical protein